MTHQVFLQIRACKQHNQLCHNRHIEDSELLCVLRILGMSANLCLGKHHMPYLILLILKSPQNKYNACCSKMKWIVDQCTYCKGCRYSPKNISVRLSHNYEIEL